MTKMKIVALSAVIALSGFIVVPAAFAEGDDDTPTTISTTDDTAKKRTDRAEAFKKTVEDRKQEIQKKVETQRAERTEKLSQKRLENCEKRQDKINNIITKSNQQGLKNLETFQKIQTRVMNFATDKKLTVASYDELVANADAKKAAAEAALDVAEQTKFECATTDPIQPDKVISTLMHTKHDALKEYRTAVKDLIVAVKKSLTDTKTTETTEGGQQ